MLYLEHPITLRRYDSRHNNHTTPTAPDLYLEDPRQRCSSVLGHINGMTEDGQWHCHLPHGHADVCLAPDGTTW
jgi:hypothetical protein